MVETTAAPGIRQLRGFLPVETHLLRSENVAQTYQIQVMRPPQIIGQSTPAPVVYVTDGNAAFDMFKSICWILQGSERELPPFILVAIGYPSDSPCAGAVLRARDLTFPGCPDYLSGLQVLSEWEGILTPARGEMSFGGAEQFQRFIARELIPFIDGKYATLASDRTYFGHSLGGSFGLYTLFTQRQLFRRYVIASPAVSYHGRAPNGVYYENQDFLLRRARDFIASAPSVENIQLYLSVGSREQFEPGLSNWEFTSNFYRLLALLRQAPIPGLTVTAETLEGETHNTAWPIAFIHGIQAVFGTRLIA